MRKKLIVFLAMSVVTVVSVLFLFPTYLFAPPSPILNPGNGHYYELVKSELNWQDANSASQGMWYKGHQGHLVTITSSSEQDFIEEKFLDNGDLWIGAYQLWSPGDDPDNGWHWVTGEKWKYENWNDDEPNDWQNTGFIEDGEEDYGEIYPTGVWNDIKIQNETQWFIVEYDLHLVAEAGEEEVAEPAIWVRDHEMACWQIWINEANQFEFVFVWEYANNNWVKIYDMAGNEVFSIDMPKGDAHFTAALPDRMYTVKTFHAGFETPIQEFLIGKP